MSDKETKEITYETIERRLLIVIDYFIKNGANDNFIQVLNLSEALEHLMSAKVYKGEADAR
jgi:hypothetical protein